MSSALLHLTTRFRWLQTLENPRQKHFTTRAKDSQYAGEQYQALVDELGVQSSMSRTGDCWDNAPKESFFGTLENELLAHRDFQTTEEAKDAGSDFVEVFYNRQRSHSPIGYTSPIEYRRAACSD